MMTTPTNERVVIMNVSSNKVVKIGKLSMSQSQFMAACAIGGALAAIPGALASRSQPWPCSNFLEILMSRQLLNTLLLGALLLIVCAGLASFKPLVEMRRIERLTCLFWGAYAGSSLGPLISGMGMG